MEAANHRERGASWVELPEHVVFLVADSLSRKRDLIRFGAVCQSWQSVYMEVKSHRSPRLPLLMLATEENNCGNITRSFYDISHKKVCNSKIPVPHNRHCPGSSQGWLATVSPDSQVRLLNLFPSSSCLNINEEIHLPPMTIFKHKNLLRKVVLSTNPAVETDYVVLAIYDAHSVLAFFKPGDKSWTSLEPDLGDITDVIFYRDHFYGVNKRGEVFACDLSCPKPKVVKVAPQVEFINTDDKRYLVESPSGKLLQVIRYTLFDEDEDSLDYCDNGFFLLKLDPVEHTWIELSNIDGLVLFLGDNLSLCLPASGFPQCKQNSVYYTDDYHDGYLPFLEGEGVDEEVGPYDIRVFSFDDHTTTPHYITKSNIIYPPRVWIEPPCRRLRCC